MSFKHIIKIIISIVLVTSASSDNTAQQLIRNIYGIRWFLGSSFQQYSPITMSNRSQHQQSHLVLMFNTLQPNLQQEYFVSVLEQNYTCNYTQVSTILTSYHHNNFNQIASEKGSNFSITVYRCRIYFKTNLLQQHSEIDYQINAKMINYVIPLFRYYVRSPAYLKGQFSIPIFGDWGLISNLSKQSKVSKSINRCLFKQVEENSSVRLMILLGDLAYDLEGQTYINFFKEIEQISRRIVILFTPGNHETIKHEDLFYIYRQSFYSPSWDDFSGYYDIVKIRQTVFLGYNVEGVLSDWLGRESNTSLYNQTLLSEYGDYFNLFSKQLSQARIDDLKNKTVISYTHYPIYCSEQDEHENCSHYLKRQDPYLLTLMRLGLDISFSAHMHHYERSKQICHQNYSFSEDSVKFSPTDDDIYQFKPDCAVFLLEGASGNNYFVETEGHIPLKNFTKAYIANTGFGILTLKEDRNEKIHFRHITAQQCKVTDTFSMVDKKEDRSASENDSRWSNEWILILIILLVVMILLTGYALCRLMRGTADEENEKLKSHENVLQLVELQYSSA